GRHRVLHRPETRPRGRRRLPSERGLSVPVAVGPNLRASFSLVRSRALAMIALGSAVVLGLVSVCCGIGVFTTPWLLCELLAMQLAEALGAPIARGSSWIYAGMILAGAVLFTAAVGWLTW